MYEGLHTAYDSMKEYMIQGSEFDGIYQIPMLPPCHFETEPIDSVDFDSSFKLKKEHRKTNINFFIDDCKFQRLWNNPDKYLEHLKCFHSVCSPDFSMCFGENGMPFALNLYNKYRNHALAWYMHMNGITIVPKAPVVGKEDREWCLDGLPKHSVIAVNTNGRVRAKADRLEFCEDFKYMAERLEPTHILIVGKVPDELNTTIPLISYKSRNQKMNERLGEK